MNILAFSTPKPSPAQNRKRRLELALSFARKGIAVFPCKQDDNPRGDPRPETDKPAGKKPMIENNLELATTDEATIRHWFKKYLDCNYGLAMGREVADDKTGEIYHTFAIDLDVKGGKDGSASLATACEKAGIDLSAIVSSLIIQSTPSGGEHLIGLTREQLKTDVGVMDGVDTRGRGGYVLGAGSQVNGVEYTLINDVQLNPMEALEDLFEKAGERKPPQASVILENIDSQRATKKAFEYLQSAPEATEGKRNAVAYSVACRFKDIGLSLNETLGFMLSWNDEKSVPPMDIDEIQHVTNSAYKYGQNAQGSAAPEAVFPPIEIPEENAGIHPLEKLNRQFALVMVGADARVLWETFDEKGKPTIEILKVETFHQLNAAMTLQTGNKSQPLTKAWIEWPQRRTYTRLVFAPGQSVPNNFYNLWKGFAVAPQKGDWSKMQAHIRDVICASDPATFQYVIGWLARMVQQPGDRGEVALVLRGGEGTGKGTLANWLRSIFGRHAVHISSAQHLVGNFNAHLRDAVFLFVDEAFWGGDRKHEGVLKRLITEPTLFIEAKYSDGVERDNCLHVLMASNEEWVVPASADARRFCVLDVSEARKQDTAYFAGIIMEKETGGPAAMLYDLLAYDLTGFNVSAIPRTAALGDQKVASLRGAERWLKDVLSDRGLGGAFSSEWGDDEFKLPKDRAYESYCDRSRKLYGEHHPIASTAFWRSIRRIIRVQDFRGETEGRRERSVALPPLKEARMAFERYLRAPVDWGEGEENGVNIFA